MVLKKKSIMAPTRRKQQKQDKYHNITHVSTDDLPTQTVNPLTTALRNLDPDLLRSLTGYGQPARQGIEKFDGEPQNFKNFRINLKHQLLITGISHYLDAPEISETDNLALYIAIAACVKDSALSLIQTQAVGKGQKAYQLLMQKYLGNKDAREARAMLQLACLKQGENEALNSYVARIENIKLELEEFGTIRNDNFFVIMALNGINSKNALIKAILNSDKIPTWDIFKERLESHGAMTMFSTQDNQILNVNHNQPQIQNSRRPNYRRFLPSTRKCNNCFGPNHTTEECISNKFCERCQNGSHNTEDCKFLKPTNPQQVKFGNDYNTRGQQQRRGRGNRPFFNATRGHRGQSFTRGRGRLNNVVQTENTNHTENLIFDVDTESNTYDSNSSQTVNTISYNTHSEDNTVENEIDFNNLFI